MSTVLIRNAKIVNEGAIFEGDILIENEFIKEIPIVGTLHSLCKIGISIRDKIFLKKIIHNQKSIVKDIRLIPPQKKSSFPNQIIKKGFTHTENLYVQTLCLILFTTFVR